MDERNASSRRLSREDRWHERIQTPCCLDLTFGFVNRRVRCSINHRRPISRGYGPHRGDFIRQVEAGPRRRMYGYALGPSEPLELRPDLTRTSKNKDVHIAGAY